MQALPRSIRAYTDLIEALPNVVVMVTTSFTGSRAASLPVPFVSLA
jgi:hypothetical protein